MNYTKMVMLPMDVYKTLLNADGQQHDRIDAPPLPVNTEEKSPIKRQPQQWILRKILKGMKKKQLSKIVKKKKNVKSKRKNK